MEYRNASDKQTDGQTDGIAIINIERQCAEKQQRVCYNYITIECTDNKVHITKTVCRFL